MITKLRKSMHNKLLPLADQLLLRKRAIIETINDQLKNIVQIEHTRHRSPVNAMVNSLAAWWPTRTNRANPRSICRKISLSC